MNTATSPFPFKLKNGRYVVDEWCSCIHFRTNHLSNALVFGHGPCRICECPRYTFQMQVTSANSDFNPSFEMEATAVRSREELSRMVKLYEQISEELHNAQTELFMRVAQVKALNAEVAELRAYIEKVTLRYDSVKLRGRSVLIEKPKKGDEDGKQPGTREG